MSDKALTEAAISWAREFLEDYPRDVSVEAFVEVGAIRVLLAEAARREALERALKEIKRCNAQYNFGSKLLRIVNAALAGSTGESHE